MNDEHLKYGEITPAPKKRAIIYKCLDLLEEEDAWKYVKKFADQIQDNNLVMHSLNELVLGAYLRSHGIAVRAEKEIDGQTPDWSIWCPELQGIIEIASFHTPKKTSDEIEKQSHSPMPTVWIGGNTDRLYSTIWSKAPAYKELVEKHRVPYVVAVRTDFLVDLEKHEVDACLAGEHSLFALYPTMSGVLFYMERSGVYYFGYEANPSELLPISLPSGQFDLNVKF